MINSKWVYDYKVDGFGWVVKAKARLVARGDMQRMFIDFGELYAPTVSVSCVRLLAALACELGWSLSHFDIEQAFTRGNLEEVVNMRLPQGCGALSGAVVRLKKSLYGLRQASRQWYKMLKECLLSLGFEQCLADSCVFRLVEDGSVTLLIVVHVDDLFSIGERERCVAFGKQLNEKVPVKDLGELKWYSGCYYERDVERGRLKISQRSYTEELGEKYGVFGRRGVPLSGSLRLWDFDETEPAVDEPFRELIGSLLWLALLTRPDLANAVRAVARYCASPKLVHWKAAIGILEYAVGTSSLGISFQRGTKEGISLLAFADADFASRSTDRRSISGGVIMCGGGPVQWLSKTQKCTTLSTTEAEYVAMADTAKEILFLRNVWRFMLPKAGLPCVPLFEDNEGSIQIAKNPVSNSNSKHIDVRHHFLRELVERKELDIIHVASEYQHADFLTKPLLQADFEFHRNYVMNIDRNELQG